MKNLKIVFFFVVFISLFFFKQSFAQSNADLDIIKSEAISSIEKQTKILGTVLSKASTFFDFLSAIENNEFNDFIIGGICGFLDGGTFCNAVVSSSLNENEYEELRRMREEVDLKPKLETFLKVRGIDPQEFYMKVYENKGYIIK